MLSLRTLKILGVLLALYALLTLPGLAFPAYYDSPAGILVVFPYLSIYLFHTVGIPGLLEHNGACGWGWCAPTPFGWVFLCLLWLLIAWLVAWGLASLFPPRRGR